MHDASFALISVRFFPDTMMDRLDVHCPKRQVSDFSSLTFNTGCNGTGRHLGHINRWHLATPTALIAACGMLQAGPPGAAAARHGLWGPSPAAVVGRRRAETDRGRARRGRRRPLECSPETSCRSRTGRQHREPPDRRERNRWRQGRRRGWAGRAAGRPPRRLGVLQETAVGRIALNRLRSHNAGRPHARRAPAPHGRTPAPHRGRRPPA